MSVPASSAAGSADQVVRRMLMEQLTSQLADSSLPGDDAGQQQVRSLFAQTLADAVAGSTGGASTTSSSTASSRGRVA